MNFNSEKFIKRGDEQQILRGYFNLKWVFRFNQGTVDRPTVQVSSVHVHPYEMHWEISLNWVISSVTVRFRRKYFEIKKITKSNLLKQLTM